MKSEGIEVADYSNNMVNQGEDEDTDYNNIDDLLSEALQNLDDNEKLIRDVLLEILELNKSKENESGKKIMDSFLLNGIIDMTNVKEQINQKLEKEQLNWLINILNKKVWKKTQEFISFCDQFNEDNCNRVNVPLLVRKSFIEGQFNSFLHEGHDIVQDIMKHFSVRLEAPMILDSKSSDLERTYAIDTVVYILNRLFRMHQDVLEWRWHVFGVISNHLLTSDTKDDKFIMLLEFSKGRKATENKEMDDKIKLGRNAMRLINKLSDEVTCDKLRVYTVQCINGVIRIHYMMRPLPSVYLFEEFGAIKIPITFDDMEQFSKDMTILMNFQADVLAMIKTLNKGKKGKIVYKVLIEDTPKVKRTRENLQINIDQDLGASTLEIGTIKRKRQKK
ncbi:7245_t:CDS:2 [Entrophospora sp. SA101]|nr:7245_t:CDS:2 [Entrophospora sp. SA101]